MSILGPFEKLGTTWWFEFFDLDESRAVKSVCQLLEVIDEFEERYSRFLPQSELSTLNRDGVLVRPSDEFVDLLHIAQQAYSETEGVFNIAVGAYLESLGYDTEYSFRTNEQVSIPDLNEVLVCNDMEIRLASEAKIDLGGMGKGYLIDKLARVCTEDLGIEYFLINGGGDIFLSSDRGEPVTINLQEPKSKKNLGSTRLYYQGFAASSPHLRCWRDQDSVEHHHLIGGSVEEVQTVYVTAKTALDADIWATALAIDTRLSVPSGVQVYLPEKFTAHLNRN